MNNMYGNNAGIDCDTKCEFSSDYALELFKLIRRINKDRITKVDIIAIAGDYHIQRIIKGLDCEQSCNEYQVIAPSLVSCPIGFIKYRYNYKSKRLKIKTEILSDFHHKISCIADDEKEIDWHWLHKQFPECEQMGKLEEVKKYIINPTSN